MRRKLVIMRHMSPMTMMPLALLNLLMVLMLLVTPVTKLDLMVDGAGWLLLPALLLLSPSTELATGAHGWNHLCRAKFGTQFP